MSGGEAVEVRLAPESIEALALRLAEALRTGAETEGDPKMISAAEVSERWGVGRRWVYKHADELGARRLGAGRRPRLRFDPAEVAERLGAPRPAGARSDGRRLTAIRANPHSNSLSACGRAMFGGQGKAVAGGANAPGPTGRSANSPGPAPKNRDRVSAR